MFAMLMMFALLAAPAADAQVNGSAVPAWDARGLGPLAAQGIACIDMTDDGGFIAVGTIASQGDPNVFLIDGHGKVMRQQAVGVRWLNQVAVSGDGAAVHALCTSPTGHAGDLPVVFGLRGDDSTLTNGDYRDGDYAALFYHYGQHSNHVGMFLQRGGSAPAAVLSGKVRWLAGDPAKVLQTSVPTAADAVTISAASDGRQYVVVGQAVAVSDADKPAANLFLLRHGEARPLWTRAANRQVEQAPPLPPGLYGSPASPSGDAAPLWQHDVKVWGPLSVAVAAHGEEVRVAAADYQGWQRWIVSSATGKPSNYGVRFEPTRPTVTVYDGDGRVLRRFARESFKAPMWCDLLFCRGGSRLIAYDHHWTSRGLGGQPVLPADDDARRVYVLNVQTGGVQSITLPDAVCNAAVSDDGKLVLGCWNGRVYTIGDVDALAGAPGQGLAVGGPSLVGITRGGGRTLVATLSGVVRMFDDAGRQQWRLDLGQVAEPGDKPWLVNQRAEQVGPGLWKTNTGRLHSDLGSQYVIEAPRGLILIDPNAGHSFQQNWARIKAAGLDPMTVRYVLATHEHGDHAPGAYLWRVVTGARFVCSDEMAYSLQHHIPLGTGYGFHPPIPTDVRVSDEVELNLAGLKVQALRLPGHTFGSMGWRFELHGKRYVSTGDLLMPNGQLGYSGSVNFSGADVLASLRKLDALDTDVVLPGHGGLGPARPFIRAGIDAAAATGWSKIPPTAPDPFYGFKQRRYLVVGWNLPIRSAAFGDVDGDGRPDVAVLTSQGEGSTVRLYLNRSGRFADQPDATIDVPQVSDGSRVVLLQLNDDRRADVLVAGGQDLATALSTNDAQRYDVQSVAASRSIGSPRDVYHAMVTDVDGQAPSRLLLGQRFGGYVTARRGDNGQYHVERRFLPYTDPYITLAVHDFNGDGREDLVTSYGAVFLRQKDQTLPDAPTLQLPTPGRGWVYMASGDFNADARPDVVLIHYEKPRAFVYYNTGDRQRPLADRPDTILDLPLDRSFDRGGPSVADWNGDGVNDLVLCAGQDRKALILLGERGNALSLARLVTVPLDFAVHYETRPYVADFNGDGLADLASFGRTDTGPWGVYVWLQEHAPQVNK